MEGHDASDESAPVGPIIPTIRQRKAASSLHAPSSTVRSRRVFGSSPGVEVMRRRSPDDLQKQAPQWWYSVTCDVTLSDCTVWPAAAARLIAEIGGAHFR
jgi:hypothetical protein